MKLISSRSMGFYKKVVPAIAFGGLALPLILIPTVSRIPTAVLPLLLIPCFIGVFVYVVMKKFVWDLVDEVYDGGDFLLVKNRGSEYRIPLTDIMNVNSTIAVNPPRITLRLTGHSANGPLGPEFSFSPQRQFSLNLFPRNPIADDLIVRVDKARSKR